MTSVDRTLKLQNRIQKNAERSRASTVGGNPRIDADAVTPPSRGSPSSQSSSNAPSKRPRDEQGLLIQDIQEKQKQSKINADKHCPPSYIARFKVTQLAFAIVQSQAFKYNFYVLICLNAIEMGLALAYDHKKYENLWWYGDLAFAMLWTIETLVLAIAMGHRLFKNFWHTLGFLCTAAAILDVMYRSTDLGNEFKITSQFIRTTRLLMLGKLFEVNTQTRIIVTALARSLSACNGVLVVILVVCYASTLMVYSVVKSREAEYMSVDWDSMNIEFSFETHFGNMLRTMMTLFSVLIISEWDSVARATFEVQPAFTIFWVVYTVVLSYGLTNVLVGIIVDTVNSLNQEHEADLAEVARTRLQGAIAEITEFIFGDDNDIELNEWIDLTAENDIMHDLLTELHVPAGFTFGDLFAVLDCDKDGHVTKSDLADGLSSLVDPNENARWLLHGVHISRCHTDIVECQADLKAEIRESSTAILRELQKITINFPANRQSQSAQLQTLGSSLVAESDTATSQFWDSGAEGAAAYPSASMPSKQKMKIPASRDDLWSECYQTLRDSAAKHCKTELDSAWVRLLEVYEDIRSDMSKGGLMPCTEEQIFDQEQLVVRSKLHTAVSSESPDQLRKALDHAIAIGIDFSQLNVELTYNDALKRQQDKSLPVTKVEDAMKRGDWSSALDMVIESALNLGVNKNILAHVLTKVSDSDPSRQYVTNSREYNDSGSGTPVGNAPMLSLGPIPGNQDPSVAGRAGNVRSMQIRSPAFQASPRTYEASGNAMFRNNNKDAQSSFLSLLHFEALKHSQEAMAYAWEAVEASGKLEDRTLAQRSSEKKPSPLSQQEEAFFVYNQICCAVQKRSIADLQRAIGQAVAAGMDVRNLDVEIAYRDALLRYHKDSSYIIRLAVDAFQRREWYLALDLIVQVSLARGGDRQSLLRAVTKIYAGRSVEIL